jgi:aspartyl-tRNA(Asn)/glutamyl-tRNA(Gln) amidotransferase subunit A
MTRQELDIFLDKLGLRVPENERDDLIAATQLIGLDKAMVDLDVIITATTATEARKIEATAKFAIYEKPLLTMPFNVTGSPAMSICCGYTESGLPLGMQIIGMRFDEATVLRLADAYEKASPWRERYPFLVT